MLVPTNCKNFLLQISVHTVQMQWSSEHKNDWCSMGSSLLRQLEVRNKNNWRARVRCSNINVKCFYFYRLSFSVEHLLTKLLLLQITKLFFLKPWYYLNDMHLETQKKRVSVCCYIHLMFQKALIEFLSNLLIVILW